MADYPHTHQHTLQELIQENPPRDKRGKKSEVGPCLEAIRVDPGIWFKYPERVTPSAQQVAVRFRMVDGQPAYEATFRGDLTQAKVGTVRPGWLYARYIGKPDPIR